MLRSMLIVSSTLLFALSCSQEQAVEKANAPIPEDSTRNFALEAESAKVNIASHSQFNVEQAFGNPQSALIGQFSPQFNWPIIPVHAILLPNGKVFNFGTMGDGQQSAQFNYDIWNPAQGTEGNSHQWMPNKTNTDIFCSATSILPYEGNVLIPGGDTRNPINMGIKSTLIFNKDNNELNRTANMNFARWYPSAITLPNGETLVHGGRDGGGASVAAPEVFNNGNWRTLWGAANDAITSDDEGKWFYPRNWVAPNGRVFGMSGNVMYFLDWGGNGAAQLAGNLPNKTRSHISTAVMYQPGKILQVGGSIYGDTQARGSNQAVTVDINSGWPQVANLPNMAKERVWGNSTVLPSGEVLITGGSAFENKLVEPATVAEIWNPNTRQFRQVARAATARLYHSISLLLPDASVLVGGGGAPGPLNNLNAEIYYPPYLFDGNGNRAQRLTISTLGNRYKYNDSVDVGYYGAGNVQRVTLIRTGAVTHSFDVGQRFLELEFTRKEGAVTVKMPNSPNIAPPGYYLLFLVNENGTPSVGRIISVNANGGDATSGGGAVNPPVVNPPATAIRVGDVFSLVSRYSNKCVDVPASSKVNGALMQQYDCNGSEAQKFRVQAGKNGAYLLANLTSGKCLDVQEGSLENGTAIQQWDCWEGSENQSFIFDPSENGSFSIRNLKSNKCLDVTGPSPANGTQIQQWECGPAANRDWYLKP